MREPIGQGVRLHAIVAAALSGGPCKAGLGLVVVDDSPERDPPRVQHDRDQHAGGEGIQGDLTKLAGQGRPWARSWPPGTRAICGIEPPLPSLA